MLAEQQKETGETVPSISPDPLIGRVLVERFLIEERIGAGGMGRVYRATQIPIGRAVAVKVVAPQFGSDEDPNFIKRFSLEASITAKLSHPNTITIFDYGSTPEGIAFLAMEYLQGRTVQQVVAANGPQQAGRVVHVGSQIARSLREAHGLGVIHRDLKPSNIMLLRHGDDEWFVKVLDFGLVKFFGALAEWQVEAQELTQKGLLMGSPHYIAPEQARGISDQRSDIYSLGVVMFQMLTGQTPFHGRNAVETIFMHLKEPVPRMVSSAKNPIPQDVEAIVRRMLSKAPEERFQSMQEVIDAFKRCSVGEGTGQLSGLLRTSLVTPDRLISQPPTPSTLVVPGRLNLEIGIGAESSSTASSKPTVVLRAPLNKVQSQQEGADTQKLRLGSKKRKRLFDLVAVLTALIGTGMVVLKAVSNKTSEIPSQPQVHRLFIPPGEHTPPASDSRVEERLAVVFHVRSEPVGANIIENDRVLGQTPFDISRPLGNSQVAIQLKLVLDGYEPLTVGDSSQGEERTIIGRLEKSKPLADATASPIKVKNNRLKPKEGRSGYKEDPY